MSRTVKILLPVFLILWGVNVYAQQPKDKDNKPHATAAVKKLFLPDVYLGNSQFKGGGITKGEIIPLLKQGLTSREPSGDKFKVVSFYFTYADKQPYEDSIGNPLILTDYAMEYCPGDTLTNNVSASVYDRLAPGDSIIIDRINVVRYIKNTNRTYPDSSAIEGKPFKAYIIR